MSKMLVKLIFWILRTLARPPPGRARERGYARPPNTTRMHGLPQQHVAPSSAEDWTQYRSGRNNYTQAGMSGLGSNPSLEPPHE